jgi:hypothetical protein
MVASIYWPCIHSGTAFESGANISILTRVGTVQDRLNTSIFGNTRVDGRYRRKAKSHGLYHRL